MANEVLIGPHRVLQMLYRNGTALGAGSSLATMARLVGYRQIVGNFQLDQPAASGYPRVRQGVDGVTWSRVTVIPRDVTQTGYQYPFAVALRLPYVSVELTQGATPATAVYARVQGIPVEGAGYDDLPGNSGAVVIPSVNATDFTAAAAVGDQVSANIVGLPANVGYITAIELLSLQNVDWDVNFWSSDVFGDASLDTDSWLEHVSFRAGDAVSIANDNPLNFRYTMSGLRIPYRDADQTLELHVSIVPRNVAKLAQGAGGDLVLRVTYEGAGAP